MNATATKLSRGFTLVEMLVAVFVIAVLISVVVGVSGIVVRRSAVDHTRESMRIIGLAMKAYKESTGRYPAEATELGDAPAGWADRDWQAYMRSKGLYDKLMANTPAQEVLRALPPDSVASPQGGNKTFVDGFGKYMDYFRDKGARGFPLLLSAGLDGGFDRQEDNVRSDDL